VTLINVAHVDVLDNLDDRRKRATCENGRCAEQALGVGGIYAGHASTQTSREGLVRTAEPDPVAAEVGTQLAHIAESRAPPDVMLPDKTLSPCANRCRARRSREAGGDPFQNLAAVGLAARDLLDHVHVSVVVWVAPALSVAFEE
jgi:hypothetical protein